MRGCISGRLLKKLERDNRIELSPPPWQGGVLPLYESRKTKDLHRRKFIAWRPQAHKALQQTTPFPAGADGRPRSGYNGLIHFHDTGGFYHGRLLLALGEALGALAVDIHSGEFLPVVIIHCDLPVLVLAPAVAVKPAGFASLFLFQRTSPQEIQTMAILEAPHK
jgi:hypothetical protein